MACQRCKKEASSGHLKDGGFVCTNCVNREKFENGAEGYFPCKICGEIDSHDKWSEGVLEDGLCFSCTFWIEKLTAYRRGGKLVIDNHMFEVGDETASHKDFRGFAGRRFTIQKLNDNSTFDTTNLWHNGEIPQRFRHHFPDNAQFIEVNSN